MSTKNLKKPSNLIIRNQLFFGKFHCIYKAFINLSEKQRYLVREYNNRVKRGEVNFEVVPCLCGNEEFDLIAPVDRYGMIQNTVLCTKCGLVLSNPRMTEKEYTKFYSSDFYRCCYEGEDYVDLYVNNKYKIETGQHIFDEIKKVRQVDYNTSVLEFGAAGGWNLLPFIMAGANVIGMDYSPSLVELGKNYGINMIQGGINDIEGTYDVIILNHVLEHFLDIEYSLKKIVSHLSQDGIIYIAVPNIMNFGMGQLQNAHTYYFSPKTLQYYCEQGGLKLIASGEAEVIHMFGIFRKRKTVDYCQLKIDGHYDEVYKQITKSRFKLYAQALLSYFHLDGIARNIYKLFKR